MAVYEWRCIETVGPSVIVHRWAVVARALDRSRLSTSGLGIVEFEIEPATRVEALISRGEGSPLEFKRELSGEDPNKVMKTVAAFANGQGGTVLFGVTDEQEIIGLGDGALTGEAVDHLTRLISDRVKLHPSFEVEIVVIGDAEILAIHVRPGPDTPYGVGTSDRKLVYYVRRGAQVQPAPKPAPEDIRISVRSRMPTVNRQQDDLY